ncbi:MAG TPA: hypothetical protein VK762_19100 [Polyangiaceae bacterium]|nr:hypothetical protein [Polyangiaceae bacterium]
MGRIATLLALGAPLVVSYASYASPARAGGALETVTEGASALFASEPPPSSPVASSVTPPLGAGSAGRPPLGATWPTGALRAPAPPAPAAGSSPAPAPTDRSPLAPTAGAVVVVASPLEADDPVPRGDALALRVAEGVAARIGPGAKASPQTAQLGTARALAGRASALVYVRAAIVKGDLRATLDVYPPMANAWDRIRNPLPAPTTHAVRSAKIDAGVRAYLTPLRLEQASVERARHDEGDVLAAACGDADGDGDNEIVLVSAARVALGRLRAGRFVAERTAAWSTLGPVLPVPMREPIAEAVVAPGAVAVGSTSRGGLRLNPALGLDASLVGLPVWGGDDVACLRPEPSAGAFDGAPVDCSLRGEARPRMAVPAPRFDAFGAAILADAAGAMHPVVAVREPSGRLRLKAGDALGLADGTFGAQLAVGDLDQDGVPEIATSADVPSGSVQGARADDAVDIATWSWASTVSGSAPGVSAPGGPSASGAAGAAAPPGTSEGPGLPTGADLRSRLHLAAPGGVRALAMCPPGDHGVPALVAVVGGEIWIVRAGVGGALLPTATDASRGAR